MTDKPEGPPHATIPWPDLTFVAHRCGYAAVFVYGILIRYDGSVSGGEGSPETKREGLMRPCFPPGCFRAAFHTQVFSSTRASRRTARTALPFWTAPRSLLRCCFRA